MITWRICRVFILILCAVFRLCCSVAVSDIVCTGEGTQCSGIANSTCDTTVGVLTCKCNTGFDEDLNDGSTCVKVVTETGCTGNATCPGIPNSICSSKKCTCKTGYTEKVNTCVKAVSETSCTDDGACTGIANSACKTDKCACSDGFIEEIDTCTKVLGSTCTGSAACPGATHSVCSSDKCKCTTDYEEKENACTLPVNRTPCSAGGGGCEKIENAICDADDGKCTCSPSFMMNVDTCSPENAALSVEVKIITMVLSAFVTIHGILR